MVDPDLSFAGGLVFRTVWFAEAKRFNVSAFAKKYNIDSSDTWRTGDSGYHGEKLKTSGFSICIADADDMEEHFDQIREFLEEGVDAIAEVADKGAHSMLDIGFTVGEEDRYTRSFKIPADILEELVELDIELAISAYPASGE